MSDAVKALKQAKAEFDSRQLARAHTTITNAVATLTSSKPQSDKDKKRHNELLYQAHLLAGLIQQHRGRADEAEAQYKTAATLNTEAVGAWKALYELYSIHPNDDKLLTVLPSLASLTAPAAAATADKAATARHQQYTLDYVQLLIRRQQLATAQQQLLSLTQLSPTALSAQQPPAMPANTYVSGRWYRLCFGLLLALDEKAKVDELEVRTARQIKKLHERRQQDKEAKEKDDKRRQAQQKQRDGKVTVLQLGREARERQEAEERAEEEDVRKRVAAKLDSDWLKREAEEERLDVWHEWCEGYGMGCDEWCRHEEEQRWVRRRLERMAAATTQEEYDKLRGEALQLCSHMRSVHITSQWAREQLEGMQMDMFQSPAERKQRRLSLVQSVLMFPSSVLLRYALAVSLCGVEEGGMQTAHNAVVASVMQQWPPEPNFTPSLSAAHFYSEFLAQYANLHASASAPPPDLPALTASLTALLDSITAYQSANPFHPLSSCAAAIRLLLAFTLAQRRDDRSLSDATALLTPYLQDKRTEVRRWAVGGRMRVEALRRPIQHAAALQWIKRAREEGAVDTGSIAWLSSLVHLSRQHDERVERRENIRWTTQKERQDRRANEHKHLTQLQRVLEAAVDSFPVLLLRAKVYWLLGGQWRTDKRHCYAAVVAALHASLDAATAASHVALSSCLLSHADCYAYLGLYTQHVLQVPLKAHLFYQKALSVEPSNETAGVALCRLLADRDEESALLSVCDAAIRHDSKCVWGYRTAARYHAGKGKVQQSIALYQQALRAGGNNGEVGGGAWTGSLLWSELAHKYYLMGSFVAALRCWQRSLTLNDQNDAARFGVCQVYGMLGRHQEVIDMLQHTLDSYRQLLGGSEAMDGEDGGAKVEGDDADDEPKRYLPVLGMTRLLAETYHSQAVAECNAGTYNSALNALAAAIQTATSCLPLIAASNQPANTGGTYTLLGNAYSLYGQLPTDPLSQANSQLAEAASLHSQPHKRQLLQMADRCYTKATRQVPNIASLWYDRGLVNRQLMVLAAEAVDGDADEAVYRQRAESCFRTAVVLAPSNGFYWLALASVLVSFLARNHCLVQSLRIHKHPTAWTHLSLFYLQHGGNTRNTLVPTSSSTLAAPFIESTRIGDASPIAHLDAARLSLQLAQTLDPLHPAVWLAQGLFNSSFTDADVISMAAGCFARSVQLRATYEARIGLCWCSVVGGSMDEAGWQARKLIEQWPTRSAGWNVHGLCSEWAGRYDEAEDAYGRAELLLADERLPVGASVGERNEEVQSETRRQLLRVVRVNRARVLCALARYADCVVLAQSIITADSSQPSSNSPAVLLSPYHLLVSVYARCGQHDEAKRVVVAAMEQVTTLRSGMTEAELETDDGRHSVQLLAREYHSLFVDFVRLLLAQAQDEEAMQHISAKLQESEGALAAEDLQCRWELIGLLLGTAVRRRDAAVMASCVESSKHCTAALLEATEHGPSHHRLLTALYQRIASASSAMGDSRAALRGYAKLVAIDPTSMTAWNNYIALRLDQQSADAATLLPLLTIPHLYDLTASAPLPYIARLRLLVRLYGALGRFEPAVAGLSERYEREEAANRRREEARLVDAEVAADATTEDEEREEAAAESVVADSDVRDDNVRHEQPLDAQLVSALAQTASTEFDFLASVAPPSSQHAVSAAARLLFLDPSSAENWQLMADSAEGREMERRRRGDDSDAGWQAVIHCRQRQYELLQDRISRPPLWPHDIAIDRSSEVANSVACLLSSLYCMAQQRDGTAEERQQRATSIASTLDSVPANSLSTPTLRWLHARCKARLAVHDGDRVQAMQHYQRCIEIADEEQSGRLPTAAVWQEISEVLYPDGSVSALQSGLRWAEQRVDTGAPQRATERFSLILSLLDVYHRTAQYVKGTELLRTEHAFLSSQQNDSTSIALSLGVLQCDFAERSAASRAAYMREVKAMQPLWQQWENEVAVEPAMRWEQPLPPRTHWHLAQLAAYQKEWEGALFHLQAVDEKAVRHSEAYLEALEEAGRRLKEAAQTKLGNEEKKG